MDDMLLRVISFVGIIVFLGLAWIASSNKKEINYMPILRMLGIQVVLGVLLLKTTAGIWLMTGISNGFLRLLEFANEGIAFVFGGALSMDKPPFLLTVLLPIVFISALIGILQYLKILPFIVKYLGIALGKVNGMGKLESYNAVASIFLGQSEVFISVKKQIGKLDDKRLYTLCASAMSTVSMSIVGSYMTMIDPKYVVTAIILNLFGGFIIVSIINPYKLTPEEDTLDIVDEEEEGQSLFEVIGEYILDGWNVAIIVGAMLIGFVGLIAMINGIFEIFGVTFQQILGYVFAPLAFLTGIELSQAVDAGALMATKMVSNEFVAMLDLTALAKKDVFSARSIGIISVFLVSFANFSSIGIIAGAVGGVNQAKGKVVARFGLKLLYGATLVSFITACIVGIIL